MGVFYTQVSETGAPSNPVSQLNAKEPKGDGNSSKELEDRFLKLLIAQMRNQDPTNPMDNSQLTSQLAQISTLAGIEKLNMTVQGVSGRMDDNSAMNASRLIGKGVMVPGDRILVQTQKDGEGGTKPEDPSKPKIENPVGKIPPQGRSAQGVAALTDDKPKIENPIGPIENDNEAKDETVTTPFGFELERDAESVVVTIIDKNSKKIRELDMGAVRAGVSTFTWNGKFDDDETPVPDGSYTFTVDAKVNGQKITAMPLAYSMVFGVIRNKNANTVFLDLGISGTVSIDEVRQILYSN